MNRVRNIVPLRALRRHRRLAAVTLLGGAAVWLALLFAQCLPLSVPGASSSCTMAPAGAAADDVACEPSTCAATNDHVLASDTLVPPSGSKAWPILLVVIASLLLTFAVPLKIPLPPQPLLPKRPRTLKFYALRI